MKYLIHADGKLPNLALMRLATYFRRNSEEVRLVRHPGEKSLFDEPGEAFGSSIFSFSGKLRDAFEREWGPVRWGGTGARVESNLNEVDPSIDWEEVPLDYSLYPDEERSIGFTQRGCRLRCEFCVVPRKEGRARSVHSVSEIWRGPPHPRKILLLDNDFFGQRAEQVFDVPGGYMYNPHPWQDRVDELRAGGYKVCFSQGINIRQVDDESAEALASLEYRDNMFNERVLYTAWDSLGDERRFKTGVETLARAGIPPKHLRVYMLVGYAPNETLDAITYRFNEMVVLGCEPYPMVYDPPRGMVDRATLKQFQRWAIRGLYRSCKFEEYDPHVKRNRAAEERTRQRLSLPTLFQELPAYTVSPEDEEDDS